MATGLKASVKPAPAAAGGRGVLELIGNTPLLALRSVERAYPGVRLFAPPDDRPISS